MKAEETIKSHIFPFLWLHGEDHNVIEREIDAIKTCGIDMFCVESRPHPDFCGEKWWDDFGFILKTAKNSGMKVWLLDDKHYPSGNANCGIERNPQLKQKFIKSFVVDFYGNGDIKRFITNIAENEKFIAAFVYKRFDDLDGTDVESGIEITNFKDNVITIEKGFYGYRRLVVLSETTQGAIRENYIDMLNSESCEMMIKEVYQPHFDHFSKYFGDTFLGFFSDEPRFMNGHSEQAYAHGFYDFKVGQFGALYPWREDMFNFLEISKKEVVALWLNAGEEINAKVRIAYMDAITKLYQKNFSEKLGKWCDNHGVMYTGHIIEDAGNHCRLGTGAGHYFRSMTGQHMSGIDVVLHQLQSDTGSKSRFYSGPTVILDKNFFHYTLAKLGVSAAHLESRKQDRAMCEIFGAYGWGETINQMKWLLDFMLVRGVNYFVPHAFNPRTEDSDCPPYFYHNGENPTYSAFCELMKYAENMCVKLSSPYKINVSVLYHAEAEWSGSHYQPMDEICKLLTESQIDFEIVPSEYLSNTESKVLIVPYAANCGERVKKDISSYSGKIIYCDKNNADIMPILESCGIREYGLQIPNKDIRVLKRGEKYFVFNEGVEPIKNVLFTDKFAYKFYLQAGESYLFENGKPQFEYEEVCALPVECCVWTLTSGENEWKYLGEVDYTADINSLVGYETFTGKVRYKMNFNYDGEVNNLAFGFGRVVGGLKVYLNGKEYTELFKEPYILKITDGINVGNNELIFELSTTLALKYKDRLSRHYAIEKCGLLAAIKLLREKE